MSTYFRLAAFIFIALSHSTTFETDESYICQLPPAAGSSCGCDEKNTERYFYNKNTQKCDTFIYSGCDGNCNNFKNLQSCKKFANNVCNKAFHKTLNPSNTCCDCTTPTPTPGCLHDITCQNIICNFDEVCCNKDGAWDELCSFDAENICTETSVYHSSNPTVIPTVNPTPTANEMSTTTASIQSKSFPKVETTESIPTTTIINTDTVYTTVNPNPATTTSIKTTSFPKSETTESILTTTHTYTVSTTDSTTSTISPTEQPTGATTTSYNTSHVILITDKPDQLTSTTDSTIIINTQNPTPTQTQQPSPFRTSQTTISQTQQPTSTTGVTLTGTHTTNPTITSITTQTQANDTKVNITYPLLPDKETPAPTLIININEGTTTNTTNIIEPTVGAVKDSDNENKQFVMATIDRTTGGIIAVSIIGGIFCVFFVIIILHYTKFRSNEKLRRKGFGDIEDQLPNDMDIDTGELEQNDVKDFRFLGQVSNKIEDSV